MIYLLLGILCSSSIALIFKHTETQNLNRYGITSVNYIAASLVSLFMMLKVKSVHYSLNLPEAFSQFGDIISKTSDQLGYSGSTLWAIALGILTGACFYYSFIYYQKSVRECGATLSGMFGKLGILIPMIVSVVLWRELPTGFQTLGIILSMLSIIMVNYDSSNSNFKWQSTLVLLFLFGGLAEFSNKLFQKYAITDYKSLFLFVIFAIAFLVSLSSTIRHGKRINFKDIFWGFLVGIPNLFSSFFLIMALDHLPTTVVFPVYSAGSIIVILLGSTLLYKEAIRKKDWIAICTTIVALILINV